MKTPIGTLLANLEHGRRVGSVLIRERASRALTARRAALAAYVADPQAPRTPAQLRQLRLDAEAYTGLDNRFDWLCRDATGAKVRFATIANHLRQRPEAFAKGDVA